ncbi:PID-CTERM protein-sorting domain-containing protein [Hymenobacter monticola]|uniref:VPDSG-CTERM sorting domain-containing protein n=1 Tax=Hymenobacter monticola TaxID=1705399 RepID=A0ABY4B8R7_9BACT|nr:hypothetical protein [Hymenobacter monticola]UOE35570.1 hypothetical protein MTP16_07930 [Hymenobacter monticola]
MKNLNTWRLALTAAALWLATGAASEALAQPGSGGPGPGTPTTPNPTDVPLDGGASLLLAAGAAYGLKRLRERGKV